MLGSCQKVLISTFFMLWHDVVKFVNLLLQPLRDFCANLICTFFPSHLYKKILSIQTNIFLISALWIGKWKICSQSMSQSWKKNPSYERWRLSLQNTSGSWIGFQIVGQEPICWYRYIINWLIKIRQKFQICVLFWTTNTADFCFRFT